MPSAATQRDAGEARASPCSVRSAPLALDAGQGPQRGGERSRRTSSRTNPISAQRIGENPHAMPPGRKRRARPPRQGGQAPTMLAGPPAAPSGPIMQRRRDHQQDDDVHARPATPGRTGPHGERGRLRTPSGRGPPGDGGGHRAHRRRRAGAVAPAVLPTRIVTAQVFAAPAAGRRWVGGARRRRPVGRPLRGRSGLVRTAGEAGRGCRSVGPGSGRPCPFGVDVGAPFRPSARSGADVEGAVEGRLSAASAALRRARRSRRWRRRASTASPADDGGTRPRAPTAAWARMRLPSLASGTGWVSSSSVMRWLGSAVACADSSSPAGRRPRDRRCGRLRVGRGRRGGDVDEGTADPFERVRAGRSGRLELLAAVGALHDDHQGVGRRPRGRARSRGTGWRWRPG